MKTVCKKLLCLMLVAMMLVSAIPMAFADTMYNFWIELYVDGSCLDTQFVSVPEGTDMDEAGIKAYAEQYLYGTYFGEGYEYVGVEGTQVVNADNLGSKILFKTAEAPENDPPAENPPAENPPAENPPADEEPEVTTYVLSFEYLDQDGNWTGHEVEIENNQRIPLPVIPDVSTKDFLYWKNGDGEEITNRTVWNVGESQNIIAVYESNTTSDDLVDLTVHAYYYVDNEFHHEAKIHVERNFEKSNKNNMFQWLYSDDGKATVRSALEAKGYFGYDWAHVKYYDYFNDGEVTKANMKDNGDKHVYIKLYSTDAIEADVMLYVHTKETAAVDRVIPMPGYTEGDYVTFADVKAAVKTKYSGSNLSISDLYTQSEWEDLLDDIDSSGAKSVKVEDNGTTKIHVIVKNAYSKADSTNPKTGDAIMIAVTTMALAAVALVSMVELKKRNMI